MYGNSDFQPIHVREEDDDDNNDGQRMSMTAATSVLDRSPARKSGNRNISLYRIYGVRRIETISIRMKQSAESLDVFIETSKDRIRNRMSSANQSWFESLGDLLRGRYNEDQADIKAFEDFLSCGWFIRLCTLQEYLLPDKSAFMNETDSMHQLFNRSFIKSHHGSTL